MILKDLIFKNCVLRLAPEKLNTISLFCFLGCGPFDRGSRSDVCSTDIPQITHLGKPNSGILQVLRRSKDESKKVNKHSLETESGAGGASSGTSVASIHIPQQPQYTSNCLQAPTWPEKPAFRLAEAARDQSSELTSLPPEAALL